MADVQAETRRIRRNVSSLYITMQRLGENDMGNLTYAEASLFHGAADLLNRLLESIEHRINEEASLG